MPCREDTTYDVAFYEAFEEEQDALKRYLPQGYNYFYTWKTIQECNHELPPAKIISTRTQSIYPLSWATDLDAIITRSTGYDHIVDYFSQVDSPIKAAYLPDYAARAVAEQALMLWTALLRNLTSQQDHFKTFLRDGLTGHEIRGRKIAVIGVGRIGSQIVDIAKGLSMDVMCVDIKPNDEIASNYNVKYYPLDDALSQADIAVCSMNLTSANHGLLNYEKLKQLPAGAIFVNIARGEISPVEDLLKLLSEGHLNGVGLDVYDHEKPLASVLRGGKNISDFPDTIQTSLKAVMELMKDPKAILTPHNAFNTEESVERKSQHTADNLVNYFKNNKFLTPIST
jgi:D-lactate dehydrogenase